MKLILRGLSYWLLPRKLLLVMKLTTFLILIATLQVAAKGDAQRVSLRGKNVSLEDVFSKIRQQTGYVFIYCDKDIAKATPVNLSVKEVIVQTALDEVLKDQPLTYAIQAKTVFISAKARPVIDKIIDREAITSIPPPLVDIKGRIVDKNGAAVSGASILIKGTQKGTTSNDQGNFSLKVTEENIVLIISFTGYKTQEIALKGRVKINVQLEMDVKALDDVVIIGYGTARRANLTSAQSSVSSKDMEKTVNTTIEQAIQGRAAGVYVTQNSGQPGGGMSVTIRGVSSINGNTEPLYVIDGVQTSGSPVSYGSSSSSNPLSGLNPADIDNVQILQGPSATSVYGSKGTNGVVLITTKRGKTGDAKIDYGFQYSVQTPPKRMPVMDLVQYAQMVREYHTIAGGSIPLEFADSSLLGKGTDWQKELFKSAPMDKHTLSMSGGNDKSRYFLSGEYLNQTGIALGSGFDRYSVRVNLDNKPREWATIGLNLSYSQTKENLTSSQENVISNALQLTPQVPVKNMDGTWGGSDATNGANLYAPVNPIAIASLTTNTNTKKQLSGGVNLGINIFKGLVFRTSYNVNIGSSSSDYYVPKYAIGWAVNPTASLSEGMSTNTYWNWNQMLQYNRQFGKHTIELMASHEAQAGDWKNIGASRTGFLTNNILDLNAGDITTAGNSGGSGNGGAMESYLGRATYNYDNRYILVGSIRNDGSSNFGSGNQRGSFPALSAAWRVSNESFFHIPFISELKIRFETGTNGNQGGGGIYSPMGTGATPTGTGFLPTSYANQNLKWESTQTNDAGLNLGLFKDRIRVEFDYYVRKTTNLLMQNPLPWYMGTNGTGAVGSPTVNIGSLQNKGWGLTINTTNITTKDFKWESNLNLSAFKTTIEAFYSKSAFVERTSWWMNNWTQRSSVGQAPWLFRGYVSEGLFQSVEEINKSAVTVDNNGVRLPTSSTLNNGVWVGDVKYKDISGPKGVPDGIIDGYDQTNIGNPWPKLFGGFSNSFSYKGFDLSIMITATYGNDIYNYLQQVNTNPNNIWLSRNLLAHSMDYAKPFTKVDGTVVLSNPGTDVARISSSSYTSGAANTVSSSWVESGSFIRLKNISLSYSVPASLLLKQTVIKGIRATFGVQNLATITGYKGYDPEVGGYVGRDASSSNQAIGLDYGRYPLTPVYTFNLGVNF